MNNGDDIGAINDTQISLVPKVKNPNVLKDFRLLILCNVVYKLVSKFIVNGLKKCMNSIIHDSQSVFVEDKLITNSLMITFEAFRFMKNGKINNANHFVLKLYLSKAF